MSSNMVEAVPRHGSSSGRSEELCKSQVRECGRRAESGFSYCKRHILEERNSPYTQCSFISTRYDRRCTNPTIRTNRRDNYCNEHSKTGQIILGKRRSNKRGRPAESASTLLGELVHSQYARDSGGAGSGETQSAPVISTLSQKILDYPSDNESNDIDRVEESTAYDFYHDVDHLDPDTRESEDIFRNAGVLTGEEVIRLYKEKLGKLQSLYIEMFKILQFELKEERRTYLVKSAVEREKGGPSRQFDVNDPTEWHRMRKLRHLSHYNRFCGRSKLLRGKAKRKQMMEGNQFSLDMMSSGNVDLTCNVVEQYGGQRCNEPVLPHCKYCLKHVMYDKKQVLFSQCTPGSCEKLLLPPVYTCPLHTSIHIDGGSTSHSHVKVKEELE